MTLRSSTFNILLLNTDSEIQAHYKDLFGEQAVTIGRDGLSLPKEPAKRAYDAVIVESKAQSAADLGKLFGGIDPARTLLVVGSRTVLKRTATSLTRPKPPRQTCRYPMEMHRGNRSVWNLFWNIKSAISSKGCATAREETSIRC